MEVRVGYGFEAAAVLMYSTRSENAILLNVKRV